MTEPRAPRGARRRVALVLAAAAMLSPSVALSARPAGASGGSISFVSSSSTSGLAVSSVVLDRPPGLQAGDLMLAAVLVRGKPTVTAPTGWTFIRHDGRSHVYYRVATASEDSSYTWTFSERHNAGASLVAYAGVDTAIPVDASSGEKQSNASTSITAPSATSDVDGAVVVSFYGIGIDTSITPPSGSTERVEGQTGGTKQISWEVSDRQQTTAGATGDEVATAADAGSNCGQLVLLTPIQSASPVYRAFKTSSYWNTPLPADAPIDPDSASIIAYLQQDSTTDYLSLSGVGSTGEWGMPIYWATSTDPVYDVASSCSTHVPPEFASIRVPRGAQPDPTSDAAMVVYDLDRGIVYSFWQASYDSVNDAWTSCGGAVYYTGSNGLDGSLSESDDPANDGHRGVPPAVFAVRWDEVQAGEIDHVLKIAVNDTKCEHVFPMTRDECGVTDQYAPPEGTRIRLKRSIDLSKYGLSPAALAIAQALQTYGAVIGDQSGGAASLKVENTVAEGDGQLWTGVLSKDDLSAFTLDDFEVIQLGYGQ